MTVFEFAELAEAIGQEILDRETISDFNKRIIKKKNFFRQKNKETRLEIFFHPNTGYTIFFIEEIIGVPIAKPVSAYGTNLNKAIESFNEIFEALNEKFEGEDNYGEI